jgi:uncharacterized coiled-coil protein SlyX
MICKKIVTVIVAVYHKFETTIKMRLLGLGKVSEVKPLTEAQAVDLAAEMLGEGVIFTIAAGTLFLEWMRQVRKDQVKEDVQNRRLLDLENRLTDLGLTVEYQAAMIREMTRAVVAAGIKLQSPGEVADELPKKIVDSSSKTVLKVENQKT